MDSSEKNKLCEVHKSPYKYLCLDDDCSESFLLCQSCFESSNHKHSKTTIEVLSEVQQKLQQSWELKDSKVTPYYKKVRQFYDQMRKQLVDLINQDQKITESLLQKITYHHLPIEANSLAYLEIKKQNYERIDKATIQKLITEADSGQLNKNLDQQKEIMNVLDVELSKVREKLTTVKYVLLSKKIQAQLLSPRITQASKVCQYEDFTKIYGLFNSRNMIIRHAKLLHRASITNFAQKQFFNSCNNMPNCMAVVKLENGKKVGGFSVLPMVSPTQQQQQPNQLVYECDRSARSFIFSITNLGSFHLLDRQKAIGYKKDACGPIFGPDLDLSTQIATSVIGNSYKAPNGIEADSLQSKVILLGGADLKMNEMQIWQLCF